MTAPVEFVIPRHAVVSDPVTGLSPLQTAMIEAPQAVRIFSAPTGAGKSFAFQKAMRERDARVLFIVPTRRLAQNLAHGLITDLVAGGLSETDARARVPIWTSDERERIEREEPGTNVRDLRLEAIREDRSGGQMVVATPESVIQMLLRPRLRAGTNAESIRDVLQFDHVVFDEFHTIDARGLGLSCAIAALAWRMTGTSRVTFLSATPIDVRTTLEAFGIPPEEILVAEEAVVTGPAEDSPGGRALHGDVCVRLEVGTGHVDALEAHRELIRDTLARADGGGQVVLIYDSIERLLRDKPQLAAWFDGLGVPAGERLAINSADDSVDFSGDSLFTTGHQADPSRFRVLVATSSVEMGVTFRAGLILMEPGHDACSFVQRIGRVARGDLPGQVIVHATRQRLDRDGWLREAFRALAAEGSRVPVDHFIRLLLAAVQRRFIARPDELLAEDGVFRRMPQSAVWCAGLFWAALECAALYKGTASLRAFRPRHGAVVGGLLSQLKRSGLRSAEGFAKAFLKEALRPRVIQEKVRVIDPSGSARSIDWMLYARTPWLVRMPTRVTDRGEIEVLLDREIGSAMTHLGGGRAIRREEARQPHRENTLTLELLGLREAWLRSMGQELRRVDLPREAREAIGAAVKLVRLTGLVPLEANRVEVADDGIGIL